MLIGPNAKIKNQKYEIFLKKTGCIFIDRFNINDVEESRNFLFASRNIVGLKSLNAESLNISDLMNYGVVCMTKDALINVIEKFQSKLFRTKELKVIQDNL